MKKFKTDYKKKDPENESNSGSIDEDDDDDEDENEDDNQNLEDLIDDNPVENDEEGMYLFAMNQGTKTSSKPRRRRYDDDDELDDDDLELIAENTGRTFTKPKRRRVVFESDDEENVGAVVSETVEMRHGTSEEYIEEENDDNYYQEDDEDEDDFIVDDQDNRIGHSSNRGTRRQAELSEAYDVFGNDFQLDDDDDERISDEEGEIQISSEIFEPGELERAYLTERDIEIRNTDQPERFQLRNPSVRTGTKQELEEETEWIYKHAFKIPSLSRQSFNEVREHSSPDQPSVLPQIYKTLELIRINSFEVPFIAFYRKEMVDLNIEDLWKLFHWDGKWTQLKSKKENMLRLFKDLQSFQFEEFSVDETPPSSFRRLTENDFESLRAADTIDQLKDIIDHFNLYYSKSVVKMKSKATEYENAVENESILKQSKINSGYDQCANAGLVDLARKYGLTPEQFAENMRDNYQRHEVKQEFVDPITIAEDYLIGYFSTPEDVLKGANCIVATQIANDPIVRSCLRGVFHERCMINIRPTAKGIDVIDENHPCYAFRYLKDKPVRVLENDQYLIIHHAEVDGFLKVEFSIDSNIYRSTYMDEIKQLYERNEFSGVVQEWNKLREKALEKAFKDILYPRMVREIRNKLLDEAKEFVINSCRQKMYRCLEVAAYLPQGKIMGIMYSDTKDEPSCAATIDKRGDVKEVLELRHLWEWNGQRKDSDFNRLIDLIKSMKPVVIAVGSDSTKVLMFISDLKNKLKGKKLHNIKVEIVDADLAKVFAVSKTAEHDLKDYSIKQRQAISLARRIQDPLFEFSQLCNTNEDILSLRLHPLQHYIDKDILLQNLYQEFINRVNEVGVDMNMCLDYPRIANLIQFVCALGPRKGFYMLKCLEKDKERLVRREDLAQKLKFGPKVLTNCVGFIKIDVDSFKDQDDTCILDCSRIHLESYNYARKMAVDALDYPEESLNNPEVLDEIINHRKKLTLLGELDLVTYANELEKHMDEKKLITLNDIRNELCCMYKDLRTPYRSPDDMELFLMLTKENSEALIGKLVSCKVVGIAYSNKGNRAGQPVGVKTILDCGVRGFIPMALLADHRVNHPDEVVKINMMMTCRITKVDIYKFQVEMTSKYSEISDNRHLKFDHYFDFATERDEMNKVNKVVTRQGCVKRIVVHPCFQNIDHITCQKQMETLEQGEAIIRPSSKEANRLTLTWKVGDGVMQIIDVWEEGKTNPSSIGKKLVIGNESFEDIDEIIARFVQPMASFARDLINYKYFKNINVQHLDDENFIGNILLQDKRASPNRIPYCFTLSKKFPGKFVMSYFPSHKSKHDYVTPTPDGLRLRGQLFNNLPNLLKWFKENC